MHRETNEKKRGKIEMNEKMELERKKMASLIDSSIYSIRCALSELDDDFSAYQNLIAEDNSRCVDIYKIINELKKDNLYNQELDEFFENYIKFKMK